MWVEINNAQCLGKYIGARTEYMELNKTSYEPLWTTSDKKTHNNMSDISPENTLKTYHLVKFYASVLVSNRQQC